MYHTGNTVQKLNLGMGGIIDFFFIDTRVLAITSLYEVHCIVIFLGCPWGLSLILELPLGNMSDSCTIPYTHTDPNEPILCPATTS